MGNGRAPYHNAWSLSSQERTSLVAVVPDIHFKSNSEGGTDLPNSLNSLHHPFQSLSQTSFFISISHIPFSILTTTSLPSHLFFPKSFTLACSSVHQNPRPSPATHSLVAPPKAAFFLGVPLSFGSKNAQRFRSFPPGVARCGRIAARPARQKQELCPSPVITICTPGRRQSAQFHDVKLLKFPWQWQLGCGLAPF